MDKQRRRYPEDFKRNAVELVRTSERTVSDVAKELGIDRGLLARWRREYLDETAHRKAFVGQGNPRDEELFLLRKEVADLRETNEILKKAMVIFTQKNPR